ncbi:hypothetical protein QF002_001077 [Paraburkholderia youngii]
MHQPISEVIRAESELRTILGTDPSYTARTLREVLDSCFQAGGWPGDEEARLRHVETHVLPVLDAFGVVALVERGDAGVTIRLHALSGTAQTGLAMVELEYDASARSYSFVVAASITFGALVGCMRCAGAQSFELIRAEAWNALERAAGWRRDAGQMPSGPTLRFGAFAGSIDAAGALVLHRYDGFSTFAGSAQQRDCVRH